MLSRRIFAAVTLLCAFAVPAHAQSTKAQLNAQFGANLPDNTVGTISPSVMRSTLSSIVNSVMPTAPVTANDIACYSGTTGLLQDCSKPWIPVTDPQFGAKCDGATDDTAAIQNGINYAAANGKVLLIPAATCNFSSALSFAHASGWGITGLGKMVSTLHYTGATTTVDLLAFGDTGAASNHVQMIGFRVTSSTTMTAGAGLHLINSGLSTVSDFGADGELGNGNLWHGIWFDGITNGDAILSYDLRAQCDGLRVNNGADLIMTGGGRIRLSANASTACAGLHIGGGFGGLECHSGDILQNARNVLVDHAITATQNREIIIHSACIIDTASVDDGIQLNDSLQNTGTFEYAGYDSGNKRHGINVIAWPNSNISIRGRIWNNGQGGTGDNIHIADSTAAISFDPASQIWGVAGGDTTGFGINCTSNTTLFGSVMVRGNPTGQNINANCNFQAFGGYPTGTPVLAFGDASGMSWNGNNAAGAVTASVANNSSNNAALAQLQLFTGTAFNVFTLASSNGGGTPFGSIKTASGATGGITIDASAASGAPVTLNPVARVAAVAIASLPTCNAGMTGARATVNNQNGAAAYMTAPTAGGTTVVGVFCNGSTWLMD